MHVPSARASYVQRKTFTCEIRLNLVFIFNLLFAVVAFIVILVAFVFIIFVSLLFCSNGVVAVSWSFSTFCCSQIMSVGGVIQERHLT